jgi:hypothetical protein
MIIDWDKVIIWERNAEINKEFNEYLKLYPDYEMRYFFELDKNKNIKLYRGLAKQIFIFLGFIFDRKIKLKDLEKKFTKEEIETISIILDEIINLSRWIWNLIYEWNILSAFILLRSLLERVLYFLIIFELKDTKEIKNRLYLYKLYSYIIVYEKADELWESLEKEKIIEKYWKDTIEKIKIEFKEWNQYRFEKWIYGQRIWIWKLIKKLINWINDSFYQTLSLSSHWVYHNVNLLWNSTFAPNLNSDLYKRIFYIEISLIREVFSKLVLYYFDWNKEIIEYFDSILLNLSKVK